MLHAGIFPIKGNLAFFEREFDAALKILFVRLQMFLHLRVFVILGKIFRENMIKLCYYNNLHFIFVSKAFESLRDDNEGYIDTRSKEFNDIKVRN